MAQATEHSTHPLLVERKPRNHNAAIITIIVLLAVLLLGALVMRGLAGKSASADVDPLSPVPAVAE